MGVFGPRLVCASVLGFLGKVARDFLKSCLEMHSNESETGPASGWRV